MLRAKTKPIMGTEAASSCHFAAANQSSLVMEMQGMLPSSGINQCWKKKKRWWHGLTIGVLIPKWLVEAEVNINGLTEIGLFWTCKRVSLALDRKSGKPHMQLDPQETGHQYVRQQQHWRSWRMVIWGPWCDLNHDWKVQCGSSDLLGLCGVRYRNGLWLHKHL